MQASTSAHLDRVRYSGRFAPSPTGPLHIGSLTAAVASYLHARQAGGVWLVRMEDIDPPREVPGAADSILHTLEAFELAWDGEIRYQSTRLEAYAEAARQLEARGLAFRCSCTRRELRAYGQRYAGYPGYPRYPGTCRTRRQHQRRTGLRVRIDADQYTTSTAFDDGIQGPISYDLRSTTGDYLIVRRDALPAYHLAVVVDDADQGITDIVRGIDLLESTAVHLHLQRLLGLPVPRYGHFPVIVDATGRKLSKQTGAVAVDSGSGSERSRTAMTVLEYLGLAPPAELTGSPPGLLWTWALERWSAEALRGRRAVTDHVTRQVEMD